MTQKTYQPDQSLIEPGCPVVTLAGREWFVPTLALRQSRTVLPALMRVLPVLAELPSNEALLSEDSFESIIDVVHVGLTRAYPTLTREDFLDLPISTVELIGAVAPVMRQTRYFNPVEEAS
jgi:hypothetical protein